MLARRRQISYNSKKFFLILFIIVMIQNQEYQQSRKYFAMIDRVGSWNKYQFIIFAIMTLINLLQGSLSLLIPYLLYQANYICPNLNGQQCTSYVCRLNQAEQSTFLLNQIPFLSLTDELGNFRCQRSPELITLQSIVFFAPIIGMSTITLFTQKFGRKNSLLLSMSIMLLGLCLVLFSKHITMLTVGLFLTFAYYSTGTQYSYCYGSQVVAEKHRILFINLFSVAYGIGMMLNSFTFYSIKHWKTILLWFYIFPTIIVIVSTIAYIQKTPIDLLASEQNQQIVNALHRIAKINGVQNPDIRLQDIDILKQEYQMQSKDNYFSPLDLIKFESLRAIAIPLIIANFISSYLFYAPGVIQKNAKINLFLDNIVSGASYIVSCFFTQIALVEFQRKKALYVLSILISVFSAFILLPVIEANSILKPCIYFFFRLLVSVSINIIYILNFESFPTQIRASAALICTMLSQASASVQPLIIKICQKNKISVNFIFIALGIISFFVTICLKQTFGNPPPEIIEQLQNTQCLQTVNHSPKKKQLQII